MKDMYLIYSKSANIQEHRMTQRGKETSWNSTISITIVPITKVNGKVDCLMASEGSFMMMAQ